MQMDIIIRSLTYLNTFLVIFFKHGLSFSTLYPHNIKQYHLFMSPLLINDCILCVCARVISLTFIQIMHIYS